MVSSYALVRPRHWCLCPLRPYQFRYDGSVQSISSSEMVEYLAPHRLGSSIVVAIAILSSFLPLFFKR